MRAHTLRKLRLPLLAAACALALRADTTDAQTCANSTVAARGATTSLLDTMLNGSDLEDAAFFTRSGGVPNIFFILDNSGSMNRLPPNGPGWLPKTHPPLVDPRCPTGGDSKDPACVYKNLNAHTADCSSMTATDNENCPIVGCGDDTVSAGWAGSGTLLGWFRDRQFFPPCQITDGYWGANYGYDPLGAFVGGSTIDYAAKAAACPYYAQGSDAIRASASVDGKAGYDPDWYCGSGSDAAHGVTSCGGTKKNFFDKNLVFHDTSKNPDASDSGTFGGDGWNYDAVNPWTNPSGASTNAGKPGTPAEFCKAMYGDAARQGSTLKKDICSSCLTNRGFFFDGRLFRSGSAMDGVDNVGYPSIWYSGNFLNFYPPKFIVARKILKDTVMDKVRVRMGMAHFNGTGADPTNNEWYSLKPTCDMPSSNWTSSRSTFINQLDTYDFNQGTPMARALLDIGQYYHTPGTGSPWFNLGTTWDGPSNQNQSAMCYACQASTIILITDGVPKPTDGNALPDSNGRTLTQTDVDTKYAGDSSTGFKRAISGTAPNASYVYANDGIPTSLCADCNVFGANEDFKNNPIRVAWYLHNFDLRKNTESTLDCRTMNGKQTIDTYAVAFAADAVEGATTLLRGIADMGGGTYVSASNPSLLRSGLNDIFTSIIDRATSFSVATVSTLQTTTGRSVIVPRFDPGKAADRMWRGHLLRYDLYSEFTGACTESPDGTGAGDLDCDGKCESVFLQDADGSFISEDDNGIFRKNDDPTVPTCDVAPRCAGVAGKACTVAGTQAATSWWDAGTVLKAQTWLTDRRVYTVVDDKGASSSSPDGKIDANDTVFRLLPTDDVAGKIAPYLRLGGSGAGDVCSSFANAIATVGDPDTAAVVRSDRTFCVKELIRYVLGADVFNDNAAKIGSGWPMPATDAGQDALPERNVKLGDVFHSAPVVVEAPLPADGILCPNGWSNQCLGSLWGTPTPQDGTSGNAYDDYAKSALYKNRRKVILVGANDGLLHAFDGGIWHGNPTPGSHNSQGDDPTTTFLDESLPPFNGYYDHGTGRELWGFLPPDLIAKLPLLVQGHQLFVDGTPMVRDVWVDGSRNALSTAGSADGRKQAREFHTVAVVGERRGGTHYFALDVTDATYMASEANFAAPKFLWLYPQTDSAEALDFGETYDDYLPIKPPIGPVRIKADSTANTVFGVTTKSGTMATPDGNVDYHERWVTFLAGGFDPMGLRGRGVHMVDVWTGKELFDFSYPTTGCSGSTDPRCQLKAPIAATVGMIMWGTSESANSSFGNQGFFDTATFGDTAGQLWTLRFSDPGELDSSTKLARNWFGGRAFQVTGCANQPFFYITANGKIPGGWLRTFAGTGDRYNLLDTYGGQCGPDNPRACAWRGCTVTTSSGSDANANTMAITGAGRESSTLALSSCSASDAYFGATSRTTSSLSSCTLEAKAYTYIDCGGSGSNAKNVTKQIAYSCSDLANGLSCGATVNNPGATLDLDDANNIVTRYNWYFSMRVFDTGTRTIFRTLGQATSYDSNRLTVSSTASASPGVVIIDGALDNPPTLASNTSNGWAMYFNHDGTRTADDHDFQVSRYDERVSSTSALAGLLSWNTVQPGFGSVVRTTGRTCQVAKCTAENRRMAFHYLANPVSGGSALFDSSGNLVRGVSSTTLVPAMGDQPTVFVNQKGQIQVALTAVNPERGASNVTTGIMKDPVSSFGVIPISKDVHACRHAASTPSEAACQ